MGKYRNRLQIIADVLAVTVDGAKKVEIMFKANLSYELLIRYLDKVLDASLVNFENSAGCYRLTRKGRDFLERFNEYSKQNKRLKEQLDDVNNEKMALKRMIENESSTESKQ